MLRTDMKGILSRVGIGAAEVDTVLPTNTLTPGESVEAEVKVTGGSDEQRIDAVYFAIETKYAAEEGYEHGVVDKFKLTDPFTIGPDEERSFAVTIDVPATTPVTMGRIDVWIETGLDVEWALDPEDRDHVEITPAPRMRTLFDALDRLGFSFGTAECRKAPGNLFSGTDAFVQEFEFRANSGPFAGRLDELEVICQPASGELNVLLEIDRRGGLLSEMTDTDESRARFSVGDESVDDVAERLHALIESHA